MLSRQLPISPAIGKTHSVGHGYPACTTATPAGSRRRGSVRWRFNAFDGGDRAGGPNSGRATGGNHSYSAFADRFQPEPLDAKFNLCGDRYPD
ncbi:hypothetical protein [Arthrobacter sp. efr-133-TYG-120]|uniref:hypothetical protein n=1 Tax=unclassified Arthrobacter TaxID=235627 RepID=UPI002550EAAE|nr:hypothetical protein [Arthrobacter sp. efr-133-TYG-120]